MERFQPSKEFLQEMRQKMLEAEELKKFPVPQLFNFQLGEITCRIIWNRMFQRPKDEHLHEFIFHAMFWVLGDHWYKAEKEKPEDERHVIVQWEKARFDFLGRLQEDGHKIGNPVIPTGQVRELISLAADMYYLQLVNELPKSLVNRLKTMDGFQGARYEIAVAASLVRAGFEIRWTDSRKATTKIHEFDAFQSYTGETIAIEAKSRRRSGTLHQKGNLPDFENLKIDIFGLYNDAMKQNPGDRPFGVFIDINLPRTLESKIDWKNQFFEKLTVEGSAIFGEVSPTFLAITNCAWHYDGEFMATPEEYVLLFPSVDTVRFPIKSEITHETVLRALAKFSKIPDDIMK